MEEGLGEAKESERVRRRERKIMKSVEIDEEEMETWRRGNGLVTLADSSVMLLRQIHHRRRRHLRRK